MHTSFTLVAYACASFISLHILYTLFLELTSPLRSIRGPFAARFSRLWYFNRVRQGHFEKENVELHKKYGKVVRVAPNHYVIDDPMAFKTIYGIGTKFTKSSWYDSSQHPDPDRFSIFTLRNIEKHATEKKKVYALYSTSSLLSYEPFVDRCTELFSQRLSEHARTGRVMDMARYMQCYAFDVIACITYGERFGFLDEGKDVNNMIALLWNMMRYSVLIGIFSEWHARLFPYASKFSWTGAGGRMSLISFVQSKLGKRKAERQRRDAEKGNARTRESTETGAPVDFLDKMLDAHEVNPQKVTAYNVFAIGQSNIIAGADSTALTLSAILYYLLKNPETLEKLRAELAEKERQGAASKPYIAYKETFDMPYLHAVIKETMRMHPAIGLPMWRVVPAGGAEISGHHFPAGSVVGIQIWSAHYNPSIFGPDAATFRPERWLDTAAQDPEVLRAMNDSYMPFGLGSRTCMGRHISDLEMKKLVPMIIRDFDFEMMEKEKEWETENYWFVKPVSFNVWISRRAAAEGKE